MVPAETTESETGAAAPRGDRVLFWRVFWWLAVIEALGLTWWFRDRFAEKPVGTFFLVTLVPVLIFGHLGAPQMGAAGAALLLPATGCLSATPRRGGHPLKAA